MMDMMKPLTALTHLALPLVVTAATTTSTSLPPPTAALDSGPIFGIATELPSAIGPVNKFLGIPYAAPPVRFARPEKPEPWTEAYNASEFGASCPQNIIDNPIAPGQDLLGEFFNNAKVEDEDCLYMNAFAPAWEGSPEGRPVVLFIHGGGWQQGDGSIDLSGFAGYEDVVALCFNYRTNIFGFPNSPSIPLTEKNLGLYDQRLAIEWAQANARAFGGDPNKLTIWGESAGSLSVDIHLNGYGTSPPFRGAIMFSGQMSVGLLATTASPVDTKHWNTTAEALNCTDLDDQVECMRNVTTEELVKAMGTAQAVFMPLTDGVTLPGNRTQRWMDGENAKVPVLEGTIAEEGRALVSRNITLDMFSEAYLAEPLVTSEQRDLIFETYKEIPGLESEFDIASAIYTDFFWQCPQGILANISAEVGNPTWRYYFNTSVTSLFPSELSWLQKFHGSDVALLFSTPTFEGDANNVTLTPQLYTFANYLRGVVGRFVRNPAGGPGWPAVGSRYAPFDLAVLGDVGDEMAAGATVVNASVVDERCKIFEEIYPVIDRVLNTGMA